MLLITDEFGELLESQQKLNEQDEIDAEFEDDPLADDEMDIEPELGDEEEEEDFEEEPEPEVPVPDEKEYLGKTEDTHFYMVPETSEEGEIVDLQLHDQEGNVKYKASEHEIDPSDAPSFLDHVIRDVENIEIDRGILLKYILPPLEQKEREEEESFEEDEEEGMEDLLGEEEPKKEEIPMESKKAITEKIVEFDGEKFDVYLEDDGTMDTVISINGKEFRFDAEFASMFRDPDTGAMTEEGLEELALDALSTMESDEWDALLTRRDKSDEPPVGQERFDLAQRDEDGKWAVIDTTKDAIVSDWYDSPEEAEKKAGEMDTLHASEKDSEPKPESKEEEDMKESKVSEEYNGWENWETWNVALWAGNDEGAYRYVIDVTEPYDADSAEEKVKEMWPDGTPDMDSPKEYDVVDWNEIADAFNEMAGDRISMENDEDEEDDMRPDEKKTNEREYSDISDPTVKGVWKVSYVDEQGEEKEMRVIAHEEADAKKMVQGRDGVKAVTGAEKVEESSKRPGSPKVGEKCKPKHTKVKEEEKVEEETEVDEANIDEALSKKYYKAFAQMLSEMEHTDQVRELAGKMAEMFKADNPRFSPDKFMAAVGEGRPAVPAEPTEPTEPSEPVESTEESGEESVNEEDDEEAEVEKKKDKIPGPMGTGGKYMKGKKPAEESKEMEESEEVDEEKKDPKAKVRSRGDCVFPAESNAVKDDKDHFPINDEGQARNALSRVNQYDSAPAWYSGDLSTMKKKVASAVRKKYPSIEVTKKATESKEEKVEESKKVEETKITEQANDSALNLARDMLGLLDESIEPEKIEVGSMVNITAKNRTDVLVTEATVHAITDEGIEITGNEDPLKQDWYRFNVCHIYKIN